jgi:ribonuclease J
MKENEDIIQGVIDQFYLISENEFTNKYINWRNYKNNLRTGISKYLYRETRRSPIVIPVIIDTQL